MFCFVLSMCTVSSSTGLSRGSRTYRAGGEWLGSLGEGAWSVKRPPLTRVSGINTKSFVLFCFGWPVEPPPPGVGQLCRTLGKSRPAASLGRPGGPKWAQFVLIPRSLAGTALRPSWKGNTKRVPAILGSVGGPCRERVWPRTRPARRLKNRPRGLPDLLRSGSKYVFPLLILIFS